MSFHHAVPCVMTNMEQFHVRVCGCGVVHISFGSTVVNVSSEVAIAISETLREVSGELRKRLALQNSGKLDQPTFNSDNVILGKFPTTQQP